jgi:hypothetical protein
MLPQDQWGVVPENLAELYPDRSPYASQLRALENAAGAAGASAAEKFLLAYQLGYGGRRSDALALLAEVRKLAPEDRAAQRLAELWTSQRPQPGKAATGGGELPLPRPRAGVRTPRDM